MNNKPDEKPADGYEWRVCCDNAGFTWWQQVPIGHVCANVYYCRTCDPDGHTRIGNTD